MKKMINTVHLEGLLYEHDLAVKETGASSKNPGTKYISGTISVATDNDCLNVVQVHYTYVTETTKNGGTNATYTALNNIINGTYNSIMANGKDKATKLRIDTVIDLNEFYSDRTGEEVLVSAKRDEGGFVHVIDVLNEDEAQRNRFEEDIVITKVTRIDANEERNTPEKVTIKGAIFNFRNELLPVEFSVLNPAAMDYFESLGVSEKNPVFTRVKGTQVSETITRTITEESAFGDPMVREVKNSRKDYVIIWAQPDVYVWDDETTITSADLTKAMADREIKLAALKQRNDEYKASRVSAPAVTKAATAAPAGGFNF